MTRECSFTVKDSTGKGRPARKMPAQKSDPLAEDRFFFEFRQPTGFSVAFSAFVSVTADAPRSFFCRISLFLVTIQQVK